MDVKIEAVNFEADKKLLDFVKEKLQKLEQIFDNIVMGEVFLKLDRSSEGENKVAEIKIMVPGKDLFAKKQCKTFEEATDVCVDALRKQIVKHKEKLIA
ncbi:ribosome-associated translation inhibitor RaiA [Putridiphycobacter roseus]|uniref:Ribosome-associated translation inhibitor RaiA n=1 Tax=Putridiphycobacter roseus TaxID=2219161 RepID=A0A2W1NC59_9FLAO|nr:ribosome-associated translation inhibitor RaiA [Putridiphycobacter roseus]PZE16935.1 ribosome-associated translation inhibitor RaiA [Putridiphycobacter roseus]